MTLATHSVIGASLANIITINPWLGFIVGFVSHFLLDAIPHWDYHLGSMQEDKSNKLNNDMKINKSFFFDLIKIGTDMFIGLLIIFVLHGVPRETLFTPLIFGAVGGVMPDALQFFYFKLRIEPLISIQKFHIWIHTKVRLKRALSGVLLQILFIFLVLSVIKFFG
ncbi:hypothetical protein C4553_01345 [Candidatus Parcubacteria bacterium]|nr:MAG: hypothetical protein C4553_01345 [Candidatus Parcubacteria bacterium]